MPLQDLTSIKMSRMMFILFARTRKDLLSVTITFMLCISIITHGQELSKQFPKHFKVEVYNPLHRVRENILVNIDRSAIQKKVRDFNPEAFVVIDKSKEIPSQYNSGDENFIGIAIVLDAMQASEKRTLTVRYNPKGKQIRQYPKKTQAELSPKTGGKFVAREYVGGDFKNTNYLRVPPEHKDHSWFIRYEGPGWESDKVGYRFYLDQRNAIDVFGKKTNEMVLQNVGLDGFESYHHMQPWGMDVMKVGKSLGLGSIGTLRDDIVVRIEKTDSVTCSITENGAVYSSIVTQYFGWLPVYDKYNVRSKISIHSGTRLSHHEIQTDRNVSLCTGIVKDKLARLHRSTGDDQHWAYLATYGKQSLNEDELGLVVFFDPSTIAGMMEDDFSHMVSLASTKSISYYFAAAWIQEPSGIQNEEQFLQYVNRTAEELAQPVTVNIKTSNK
jgi:hypothetical protein